MSYFRSLSKFIWKRIVIIGSEFSQGILPTVLWHSIMVPDTLATYPFLFHYTTRSHKPYQNWLQYSLLNQISSNEIYFNYLIKIKNVISITVSSPFLVTWTQIHSRSTSASERQFFFTMCVFSKLSTLYYN